MIGFEEAYGNDADDKFLVGVSLNALVNVRFVQRSVGAYMKRLLSGFLAWWAFLHLIWMASTFLLFGVLVISDDNPLQAIFEWLYDAYAFGVFQMRGWVILGFAPGCWLLNYVLTGTFRFLPWKPAT